MAPHPGSAGLHCLPAWIQPPHSGQRRPFAHLTTTHLLHGLVNQGPIPRSLASLLPLRKPCFALSRRSSVRLPFSSYRVDSASPPLSPARVCSLRIPSRVSSVAAYPILPNPLPAIVLFSSIAVSLALWAFFVPGNVSLVACPMNRASELATSPHLCRVLPSSILSPLPQHVNLASLFRMFALTAFAPLVNR